MTIACPSPSEATEPGAWGARNRVTLYPGKVQTWVLARATDRDHPSDLELRKMARAVFARWFSDTPTLDIGSRSGSADEITVGQVSASPIELDTTLQTYTKLPGPLPLLKASKVLYVPVRFIWRSESETSRAWPTYRANWGFAGPCPVEADWMLYSVGTNAPELEKAPPEDAPRTISEELESVGTAIQWVGVGLLVFGVGYTINAFRGR